MPRRESVSLFHFTFLHSQTSGAFVEHLCTQDVVPLTVGAVFNADDKLVIARPPDVIGEESTVQRTTMARPCSNYSFCNCAQRMGSTSPHGELAVRFQDAWIRLVCGVVFGAVFWLVVAFGFAMGFLESAQLLPGTQ